MPLAFTIAQLACPPLWLDKGLYFLDTLIISNWAIYANGEPWQLPSVRVKTRDCPVRVSDEHCLSMMNGNLRWTNLNVPQQVGSGSSLIQELRFEHFSLVQAAPAIDGDKIMRLRAQTAKIEGGFVLFPLEAHWLEIYLLELLAFPNSKYDDQVDSTVFALAWSMLNPPWHCWTKESLKGLENLTEGLAFSTFFG